MTDKFQLSQPQRRIWNIEKIYQGTSIHCIGGATIFNGSEVDPDILQRVFSYCLKNNAIFRLRFGERNGEPYQYFGEELEGQTVDRLDFSDHEDPCLSFYGWAKAVFSTPFIMMGYPLFYVAVVKITSEQAAFFLKFHHIIMDGWSVALFIDQAYEMYGKISRKDNESPIIVGDYRKFVEEEKGYQESGEFIRDKLFWGDKFNNFQPNLLEAGTNDLTGKRKQINCSPKFSELVLSYARNNKISINVLFIAVFLLYELRRTGKEDLTIGIPLLNRNTSIHKKTIGMYTSTMPFRIQFSDNLTIKQLLMLVKQELKEGYQHQKYPYNFLVQDLELRKKGGNGLYNICVNYYATKLPGSFNGLSVINDEFYCGCQPYDLQISIKEWGGSLQLQFDYRKDYLTDFEIDCLGESVIHLATTFCVDDRQGLDQLVVLSDDRKKALEESFDRAGRDYFPDECLLNIWKRNAEGCSDVFIFDEDGQMLTRGDFFLKVLKMCNYLKKYGVRKQDRIGILMSHSIECVVSIMAILASGGVFVPIDPNTPVERIRYILEDTLATLVITNLEGVNAFGLPFMNFKDIEFEVLCAEYVLPRFLEGDLAYIMYTSGSTGRPKGVAITHANLLNYCRWATDAYVRSPENVFAFFSSIGFDLTITSIFVPTISRAKISVFFPDKEDVRHVLYRVFDSKEVTIVKCTPSHLALLEGRPAGRDKKMSLIIGGEDLKVHLVKNIEAWLGKNLDLYNEYGPTEATVGCMIHKFNAQDNDKLSVPIGKPISNTSIYLLDDKLRQVPIGCPGEIFIGGLSVSPGYWNCPGLNEERFIRSPFDPSSYLFRTGDIGRFGDGYAIVYDGRMDRQVKINGNRVELREIECVLRSHESVRDAYLKVDGVFLIAYLVVNDQYSTELIKDYLSARLPRYMIPAYFVPVENFPLNKNGKIDILSMPAPIISSLPQNDQATVEFTREESWIIPVVKEILQLEVVNAEDNFFSIGGDSIAAIRLSSRLYNIGFVITTQAILRNPVISDMAKMIRPLTAVAGRNDHTDKTYSDFSTSTIDWFFAQEFKNPEYYHHSVLLEMKVEVNGHMLEEVFKEMIVSHDSLRLIVHRTKRTVGYSADLLSSRLEIKEYQLEEGDDEGAQFVAIGEEVKRSITFNGDFLFRVALISRSEGKKWMLLVFHHLLVDAVSWEIILNELRLLIGRFLDGRPLLLQGNRTLWCDWARNFSGGMLQLEEPEKESVAAIEICMARKRNREPFEAGGPAKQAILEGDIDLGDQVRFLKKMSGSFDVTSHELLMMIFLLAWGQIKGQREILFEVERHGRDLTDPGLPDIGRTIGWFTIFDLVYAEIPQGTISQQIRLLKEQVRRKIFEPYRYSRLKDTAKLIPKAGRLMRFNYLGDFREMDNVCFQLSEIRTGWDIDPDNLSSSEFEFNCWIVKNKLCFRIVFDVSRASPGQEKLIIEVFKDIFNSIADESDLHAGLSKDDLLNLFV